MKHLFPLLGIMLLVGCGPAVEISPPDYIDAHATGVIQIKIDDAHKVEGEPVVRLFPKYQSSEIQTLTNKPETDRSGNFTLRLPALSAGEYRLVLEVPYTIRFAGLSIARGTQQATADFVVHEVLPASCFRFDTQEKDLMGWTTHGVYINNRDKPVSKETCPGLFYINSSWPYALHDTTHGGSLFVPVSSDCFPKSSPQLSEPGQWTFAFVSPDLQERPEWQQLRTIRFHMATKSIPVTVLPEVEYVLHKTRFSTLTASQNPPRYPVSSGRWSDHEYPVALPAQAVITKIKFHVYGTPEKTVSEQVDSIYLDAVCPQK